MSNSRSEVSKCDPLIKMPFVHINLNYNFFSTSTLFPLDFFSHPSIVSAFFPIVYFFKLE
jgi:hypothetical protein